MNEVRRYRKKVEKQNYKKQIGDNGKGSGSRLSEEKKALQEWVR